MQIQISWLLQKPTELALHCLQRQGISGFFLLFYIAPGICIIFYLFLYENIYCDYSLEVPQWDASTTTYFLYRNKKNISAFCSGRFKVGLKGSAKPPLESTLFHFHGECWENAGKIFKSNPPQQSWTPFFNFQDLPLLFGWKKKIKTHLI